MKLNKDQIINLVLTAYGFVHDCGVLYCCSDYLIDDDHFTLVSTNDDAIELTYENAEVTDFHVSFTDNNGDLISFTTVVAVDKAGMDSLLA